MAEPRRHGPRAAARRAALLEAAVDVAAESGMSAVTHRRVTERAGLPLATASYFFTSIDELAAEAMRVFTEARTAELGALADALRAEQSSPGDLPASIGEAATSAPTWTLAQFEAYLHAARDPRLRPAVAATVTALDALAGVLLEAVGGPDTARLDTEAVAASFVALVDGMALRRLALGKPLDPVALERALRALFLGYISEAAAR